MVTVISHNFSLNRSPSVGLLCIDHDQHFADQSMNLSEAIFVISLLLGSFVHPSISSYPRSATKSPDGATKALLEVAFNAWSGTLGGATYDDNKSVGRNLYQSANDKICTPNVDVIRKIPIHFIYVDVAGCGLNSDFGECQRPFDSSELEEQVEVLNRGFSGKDSYSCPDTPAPTESAIDTQITFELGSVSAGNEISLEEVIADILAVEDSSTLDNLSAIAGWQVDFPMTNDEKKDFLVESLINNDYHEYILMWFLASKFSSPSTENTNCDNLNVYVVSHRFLSDSGGVFLGMSSLPWDCSLSNIHAQADGILLFRETMPGGSFNDTDFFGVSVLSPFVRNSIISLGLVVQRTSS